MIVAIHQPHFLPWLGYLNKVVNADTFVWLHDVQYRKNYYQNRTLIKGPAGGAQWLTVPAHAPFGTHIDQVKIAGAERALSRLSRTIEQSYRHAPFFDAVWPAFREVLARTWTHLEQLNLALFDVIRTLLDIRVGVLRSGDFDSSTDPNLRILRIVQQLGATTYLAGRGGRKYMDLSQFEKAGVRVVFQEFPERHPVYPQGRGDFVPSLSVIDALFHVGPGEASRLTREVWQFPSDERV